MLHAVGFVISSKTTEKLLHNQSTQLFEHIMARRMWTCALFAFVRKSCILCKVIFHPAEGNNMKSVFSAFLLFCFRACVCVWTSRVKDCVMPPTVSCLLSSINHFAYNFHSAWWQWYDKRLYLDRAWTSHPPRSGKPAVGLVLASWCHVKLDHVT